GAVVGDWWRDRSSFQPVVLVGGGEQIEAVGEDGRLLVRPPLEQRALCRLVDEPVRADEAPRRRGPEARDAAQSLEVAPKRDAAVVGDRVAEPARAAGLGKEPAVRDRKVRIGRERGGRATQ